MVSSHVEEAGYLVIRTDRGCGQVPRAAIIGFFASSGAEGGRERTMRAPAGGRSGSVISTRAQQRMAETKLPSAEADQPSELRLLERCAWERQLVEPGKDGAHLLRVAGGRDEERALCVRREQSDSPREAGLDAGARRDGLVELLDPRALLGGQKRRDLHERQRVPARRLK